VAGRLIFDSGSKTLTNDGARGFTPAAGFGVVLRDRGADSNLVIERLSEEHATVKVVDGATDLEPGDLVRIVPNHSCVVSNLVDQAWIVDGNSVEPLPIAARGRIA
jgi:D-serine deaminase-like pyridoxal phosphate-dependent protein